VVFGVLGLGLGMVVVASALPQKRRLAELEFKLSQTLEAEKAKALSVLARAVKANPGDEKLRENQKALQNGERLRMKPYGQEWWALRLEPMPMDAIPAGLRPQVGFRKGWRQPPKERSKES